MIDDIEVILGTYEEFLLGYKGKLKEEQYALLPTFSTKSHTASVRCVTNSGKYLASGGADDKIFIFDMNQRREIHILTHHEGTVNALAFTPDSKILLSGGDDGRMFATRVDTWKIEHSWEKAHDGTAVRYIACHPSGKIALSLGQNLIVRTWNLITGRCVFQTNLKSKEHLGRSPECIEWSPNGENFLLSGLRVVELISINNKKTAKEIKLESKPICVCWLADNVFAIGLEDGNIALCTIKENDEEIYIKVDETRVKAMAFSNQILGTASSSGAICLWQVDSEKRSLVKLASINIGCRPTCITLLNLRQFKDEYLMKEPEDENNDFEDVELETKVNLNSKQKVTIEYDDDDDKTNETDSDSKEENNNSAGAFVLLNKKRKTDNTLYGNAKKIKKKNEEQITTTKRLTNENKMQFSTNAIEKKKKKKKNKKKKNK